MGIVELLLILLIVSAVAGRGYLALGVVFDFIIALLVIGLLYRLMYMVF